MFSSESWVKRSYSMSSRAPNTCSIPGVIGIWIITRFFIRIPPVAGASAPVPAYGRILIEIRHRRKTPAERSIRKAVARPRHDRLVSRVGRKGEGISEGNPPLLRENKVRTNWKSGGAVGNGDRKSGG